MEKVAINQLTVILLVMVSITSFILGFLVGARFLRRNGTKAVIKIAGSQIIGGSIFFWYTAYNENPDRYISLFLVASTLGFMSGEWVRMFAERSVDKVLDKVKK